MKKAIYSVITVIASVSAAEDTRTHYPHDSGLAYRLSELESKVWEQKRQLAYINRLLEGFSLVNDRNCGHQTLRLTGRNFQVVNGRGETRIKNGCGNVVVGYNEDNHDRRAAVDAAEDDADVADDAGASESEASSESSDSQTKASEDSEEKSLLANYADRTGSHNIVTGTENSYTSTGGYVGGNENTISGRNAVVMTGEGNTASGTGAFIATGASATASGFFSASISGSGNTVSGDRSVAVTGRGHTVSGPDASAIAGNNNVVGVSACAIVAGVKNECSGDGDASAILAGYDNDIRGFASGIGAGFQNIVRADRMFLGAERNKDIIDNLANADDCQCGNNP